MAGWQSGHAADCNSVYAGSIPTPASIYQTQENKEKSTLRLGTFHFDFGLIETMRFALPVGLSLNLLDCELAI